VCSSLRLMEGHDINYLAISGLEPKGEANVRRSLGTIVLTCSINLSFSVVRARLPTHRQIY